jgi:hypothetical protein
MDNGKVGWKDIDSVEMLVAAKALETVAMSDGLQAVNLAALSAVSMAT